MPKVEMLVLVMMSIVYLPFFSYMDYVAVYNRRSILDRCPILVRLYPKIRVQGASACHEHGWGRPYFLGDDNGNPLEVS